MNETKVAATSIRAYNEHARDGKCSSQRARILAFLRASNEPQSRAEICRAFTRWADDTWDHGPNIPLASVCGRVHSLEVSGLIAVDHVEEDRYTGHRVEYMRAIEPAPVQQSFEEFMR